MFDPISKSLHAISVGSPGALALVFAAGVVSSIGPCAAPRLIAAVGLVTSKRGLQIWATLGSFLCGLVLAYASFGIFATLLGRITLLSGAIYCTVGLVLAASGIVTLARPQKQSCGNDHGRSPERSLGAVFLLGASFALVISPCCTPIVVAILAYCTQVHSVGYGASLLALFALGHAVPIFVVAFGTAGLTRIALACNLDEAFRIVGGTLMLALSGYYLCLA
ncbi:MAG: hypothetical protein NVSMB31_03760 [Vulcanimicrobiaceae bacterium]